MGLPFRVALRGGGRERAGGGGEGDPETAWPRDCAVGPER